MASSLVPKLSVGYRRSSVDSMPPTQGKRNKKSIVESIAFNEIFTQVKCRKFFHKRCKIKFDLASSRIKEFEQS